MTDLTKGYHLPERQMVSNRPEAASHSHLVECLLSKGTREFLSQQQNAERICPPGFRGQEALSREDQQLS